MSTSFAEANPAILPHHGSDYHLRRLNPMASTSESVTPVDSDRKRCTLEPLEKRFAFEAERLQEHRQEGVKAKLAPNSKKEEKLEHEEMTIEDILRARADGSHSTHTSKVIPKNFPRANKNRPMEMSSKVWVGRYREVIQVPRKPRGDPRFDPLCRGTFNPEKFRKDYSFFFDEELPKEKERLKKLIKKSKDPNVIEELKNEISSIDKQIKPWSRKSVESEILSEHKKKEREAAKKGKRPYYLKKSEIRERKLIKKYNELKASGNLDSYIEKRQKRNASKDHRYMPYRRE